MSLLIATRSSELALVQARQVQARLAERGIASELKSYKTIGDTRLDQPLSAIGAKGLFTRELEEDLAAGRVHCCVHSLKDLPTDMPPGLEIVALLEREDPRDALLVSPRVTARTLADLPSRARVGTSSLRRRAQVLALRPDLEVVELRGNVLTRIRKIDEGQVDAAILAAAGLHRLGLEARIAHYLNAPEWLGAAGQGAIAIQIRSDDAESRAAFAPLDHCETSLTVRAERAFLAGLEGGCQVPIGAAVVSDRSSPLRSDGEGDRGGGAVPLVLHGFIADIAGTRVVRGQAVVNRQAPAATGAGLAEQLRQAGGNVLLAELRAAPRPQPE
jgi:hydroxymethylbilane synthase